MIGDVFRDRRNSSGLDLREIARVLRIRFEYLEALENNRFDKLPPDVYTRGYIRAYAGILGIDPLPLLEEYSGRSDGSPEVEPEPIRAERSSFLSWKYLLPVFAVFIIVIPIVVCLRSIETFEETSARQGVASTSSLQKKKPPEAPATLVPRYGSGEAAPVNHLQRYMLRVIAEETTWLRIEMDGGKAEEALLKPGESREWASERGFGLKIGNAGGVKLFVNGKDERILGKKGEVVRLRVPREDPEPLPLTR